MLNNKKIFYVSTLGCKVNRAEVDEYSAYLISAGWSFGDVENANLIIINTCTVTATADKKTRQVTRKLCRQNTNKNTEILLIGCAANIDVDLYKSFDKRIVYVKKHDVLEYLSKFTDNNFLCEYSAISKILASENFRTRASIKIQDGCENNCSFCIVHVARGNLWSLKWKEVETKFSSLLDAGIKEVVLSGVNLGSYNSNGVDLAKLCQKLLYIIDLKGKTINEEVPFRIRLSSIEPQNVSDSLIDIISKANGKICRHLHLPLQSGSSKVLKEMNRLYSAEEYKILVDKLRNKIPSISLSTDIIVGFPGETENDFNDTYKLANECGFMKIHVFPYSKRCGTPAALRDDQIPDDIKNSRAKKLRLLSDELRELDYKSRLNTCEYALCETKNIARTESYHELPAPKSAHIGDLVKIKL